MTHGGLHYHFTRLSIAEKLIVIHVLIFIADGLSVGLLGYSFSQWFHLPKALTDFLGQPWSLVTYSFFHAGLAHVFWNMLMLYFAGRIFLNLFSSQQFINVYFLGVSVGGLFFLLSYNIFPALLHTHTALIGASAGVTAILIFVCTYLPYQEVRIIFFNVKLWHVGVFFVLVDLIQIPYGGNIGGRLSHLGGALLGYIYAKRLVRGSDAGARFAKFKEALTQLAKQKEKKPPLKTVHRKNTSPKSTVDYDKKTRQRKIDTILDKISKSGYESLSKAEKDFLFKIGKEE